MARSERAGAGAIDALLALDPADQARALRSLNLSQRRELLERWYGWEHDGQREPAGDWRVWLIRAGRGFGKTRAGAEWTSEIARRMPGARIALVGANMDDARRVMIEGPSGLIAVARSHEAVRWRKGAGELTFASGAVATLYSAETPDILRGPEHHAAWCDELAKGRRGEEAWDNLMLGLRL
ncbi:MAG: DNA-packaging protein, partial [Sphingomonadales bacterium]|nr:DNA-packaging protein [Sphingomonadales bacterium]